MHLLPLARATKRRGRLLTFGVVAKDLAGRVFGRIPRTSHRQSRTRPFHETGGHLIGHLGGRRDRLLGGNENGGRSAGTFASWTGIIRPVAHIAVANPAGELRWRRVGWCCGRSGGETVSKPGGARKGKRTVKCPMEERRRKIGRTTRGDVLR